MDQISGTELVAAINARQISAEENTSAVIARAKSRNSEINAFSSILDDEALVQARTIDTRLANGEVIGPLAGLPVAIKENCDVKGACCAAGLAFRKKHKPKNDSVVVKKLRDAGAIIIGITYSDPGAFDVRTPQVTNPIDPQLTVGGSSGGSAAALAANMCLGAIGTDTGGSIRIPAACCGIAGLKPSFGKLSMDGIFPLVSSLDHVGPMAQSVSDLELIWSALDEAYVGRHSALRTFGFDPRYFDEVDLEIRHELEKLIKFFSANGIECREVELPDIDEVSSVHGTVFIVEAACFHLAHFGEHREVYPDLARKFFDMAEEMAARDYINACIRRADFSRQLDLQLKKVDCIITPSIACKPPLKNAENLRIGKNTIDFTMALVRHTCLFNHTGLPSLVVPLKSSKSGVPSSFQFTGNVGSENSLIAFGKRLERIYRADTPK